MKLYISFIALVFTVFSSYSNAQSMTKSCSGTMQYCDEYGFCTDEYFYLYAYQYVKFYQGELRQHRYRFNFRGFVLGEEDDYVFSNQHTQTHMLFNGPDFDLAIPWNKTEAIYSVNRSSGEWSILCR